MKLLSIFSLALLVGSCPADARIGETKAQIDTRYGAPTETKVFVSHGARIVVESHRFEGFKIAVSLVEGICEREFFQHEQTVEQRHSEDPLKKMEANPLTPKEIEFFLSLNAGNATWKEARPYTVGWSAWDRSDNLMRAYFAPAASVAGGLSIESAKYASQDEKPKDEKKGF